jgi:hypothetical protein
MAADSAAADCCWSQRRGVQAARPAMAATGKAFEYAAACCVVALSILTLPTLPSAMCVDCSLLLVCVAYSLFNTFSCCYS